MKKVRCAYYSGCTMVSCPHHAPHTEDDKCTPGKCSHKDIQVTCIKVKEDSTT